MCNQDSENTIMKHQSSLLYRKGRLVLLFLLLTNFHIMQAICKPIDTYTTEVPAEDSSAKIYLSEGGGLTIAEGTIISATEFVYVKKTKIKLYKKTVKKIKVIKKEIRNIKPQVSPAYTFSPCKPNPILESYSSSIRQGYINFNSSFESFAVTQYNTFISIIVSFPMIRILSHQAYSDKILLLGNNLQRPPPIRRY